ncbi:ABC transporter substrate-binding protein [Salinibacterium sp. SYSU T00001]|uniref:ABC transporter substrate-binding protein n=1 Tax=Homoserinimonas sedimenticola TaxID=2986805 RepID=UPI0022357925|nr:ABC transporter substrate-binding protein [Salinibacterium sedimenticola]MCW4386084.1 ABC transporter substrate-binding protein [Salinibacterium sedimenticola]
MTLRRNRALAIVGAASVFALAACSTNGGGGAAEDVPGVTEDTVTIGTHQPLTGPAAAGFASISAATSAYFDYINDNGGINGRQIEFIVKDDGYNPANTQTVVRELVLEDDVFAILGGLGTPTHSAVLDFLNENEVPDLFVSGGSPTWDQPEEYPWTFGYNSEYTSEAAILANYAQEEFPDGTYCMFGQDDDFGDDFEAGLLEILGDDGLAASERYSVANQDVTAQISALKAAGCDVVFLASINGFTALAVGTAAQLGLFPQWMSSSSGGDYGTLETDYLQENAPLLLENFISTFYLSLETNENDPWVEHFQMVQDEYNGGGELGGNEIFGMNMAYMFAEALAAAGENPTRESLVEAVESGAVDGTGIVPLGYSPEDHTGNLGVRLSQVKSGVQAYFGDTYIYQDGEVSVYDGGAVPFENEGIPTAE